MGRKIFFFFLPTTHYYLISSGEKYSVLTADSIWWQMTHTICQHTASPVLAFVMSYAMLCCAVKTPLYF